ncbi:aminotransferase class V-fold PLP-dependent enzyme [Klebsiella pneumoniae]
MSAARWRKSWAKFGVDITFVDLSDLNAWKNAVRPETKLLFVESPSNPLAEIADIQALADIAHANGALLAVDNSFCTPVLQQPLKLGADLVIYSATKYLDGQGRALGGAVVGNHQLLEEVFSVVRTLGPSMSPFNAWIFLKGLSVLQKKHDLGVRHSSTIKLQYRHLNVVQSQMIQQYGCLSHHVL